MSTVNRLNYEDPYLDDVMRGWLVKTASENFKRIANFQFDDLLQEGYLCFFKCKNRYVGVKNLKKRDGTRCRYLPPKKPDKEARMHFQSLCRTAFNNRISTLALKQPRGWEIPISTVLRDDQTLEQAWENLLPDDQEVASAANLLANAPNEIKQLFDLLINDALDFAGYRRFGHYRHAPRETNNQLFCRMLGLKPGTDVVGQVEAHFLK